MAVALGSSELAAATIITQPALVSLGQPVEQRGGHLGVAEHAGPFSEGEIGGDDNGGALVKPADEMEQKLAAPDFERFGECRGPWVPRLPSPS